MRYYTTGEISENMHETPEGYLLCLGAVISRCGEFEYAPGEVPVEYAAEQSIIRVERPAEELFSSASIASYEGKPVTLSHPDDFVTPENWKDLAEGVCMNVRRGEGAEVDCLLGDLLITGSEAIERVRGGLRETSCGYDAQYEDLEPGRGRQRDIIGNHIALVRDARCGKRCKIKDEGMQDKKNAPKAGFLSRLFRDGRVQKTMDEVAAELEKTTDQDQAGEGAHKQPPAPAKDGPDAESRLAALEESMAEIVIAIRSLTEAQAGKVAGQDEKNAGGTVDSEPDGEPGKDLEKNNPAAKTADAETVRRAKILAPLVSVRVGDSAAAVKRACLRQASQDEALKGVISACLGEEKLEKVSGRTLDAAFVAAAEVARERANLGTAKALNGAKTNDAAAKPVSPADINEINRKYYGQLGGK